MLDAMGSRPDGCRLSGTKPNNLYFQDIFIFDMLLQRTVFAGVILGSCLVATQENG